MDPMRIVKGAPGYAALACLAAAAACSGQDAKAVFQRVCSACHAPESVVTPRSRAQWQETIAKMIALGARVTEEESHIVLDYLSSQSSGPTPPAGGGRDGRGRPG